MPITAQALALTHSDRVYLDPWEKVLDCLWVQQYAADHSNAGRVSIGRALYLPPGRIRGWINGGMPDSVHAIQIAINYGWLEADPTGDTDARSPSSSHTSSQAGRSTATTW